MQNTIFSNLESALKKVKDLVSNDGSLLRNKCLEWAEKMDAQLIGALLKDNMCLKTFFAEVDGVFVFDKTRFIQFLHSKQFLPDSYTAYKNTIGLVNENDEFISKTNDVVLTFPYKDCVLAGGQTKDEEKRNEVFYNEVLAPEAITTLFSPKAFCKVKRIGGAQHNTTQHNTTQHNTTQHNITQHNTTLSQNADSTFDENFLIKGNNLIALHSLKARYRGKIKLIYIDPPYNTGNDSFNYNDRFNHSTWLTFMKNRLEVARELLRDDGVIFVQCDDNEQAYLKVLMDEIFGRENFVSCVVWANKEGGGKSDSKHFRKKHEFILCYGKNKEQLVIYPQGVEDIERYKLSDKHEATRGKYQLIKLDSGSLGWVKSLDYPIELEGKVFYAGGDKEKWQDRQNGGASIKDWGWRWRWSKAKLEWGLKNDFVEIKQNSNGEWNIYTKQYLNCDKDGNILPRRIQPMALIEKHSNTQSNKHMKELFGKVPFNYSKPEGLIFEILNIATSENDIVLDFFVGSGTTCAVAHKMKRRYIGIEQMDYIENITVERLKKVIDGEQGGVSKAVNWQGGGSFVYMELAQKNGSFVEKINKCKTESEIIQLTKKILQSDFVNATININEVKLEDADYKTLSIKDKKTFALELLDKNQLYVQAANLDDAEEAKTITENDKAFTKMWYGIEN